jgi:hypothetical protein
MSFTFDPIEQDPDFAETFAQVERIVEAELKDVSRGIGFCHLYWETKKRVLKEQFGIDWKSPSEMNPDVLFD